MRESNQMRPPAQRRRYDRRVLPRASPFALAALLPFAACVAPAGELRAGPGYEDLWLGDRWLLREVCDPAPRGTPPLVRYHDQLVLPGSTDLLTRGEGPGLFPHHRGVFLGWNRVRYDGRSADFWHLRDGARIVREAHGVTFEPAACVRTASLAWIDGDGRTVLRETRRTRAAIEADDVMVLDYDIGLATAGGEVELDGDAQHAGFQFRAADEVAAAPDATVTVLAPGAAAVQDVPAGVRGAVIGDARWLAQRYTIAGRRCTVLLCDHPDNPRPTVYGVRPYGRFGAFPRVRLLPDRPAHLRYRLVVLAVDADDPRAGPAALEQRWQDFAAPAP
jgi:hypothetical protein